jgi:hypothetical protein
MNYTVKLKDFLVNSVRVVILMKLSKNYKDMEVWSLVLLLFPLMKCNSANMIVLQPPKERFVFQLLCDLLKLILIS